MCGDITYSKEADKLYFCGEELSRLKHKYPDVEIDKLIVDCDGVSDELCMIWTCGRDSDMEKDTVTFKVCMNRHGYHWNGSKWQKYKAETR